ncbi:hypothetical protein PS3A_15880 [Pseudomonas sp. 3A(2025)]
MDAESAVKLVCARLLGENSIPVKIRTREHVSEEEVNELFFAIDFLIVYYRGQEAVPKELALAFVDIYVGLNSADAFYDEDQVQRYEDIGIALQQKAYALFESA